MDFNSIDINFKNKKKIVPFLKVTLHLQLL